MAWEAHGTVQLYGLRRFDYTNCCFSGVKREAGVRMGGGACGQAGNVHYVALTPPLLQHDDSWPGLRAGLVAGQVSSKGDLLHCSTWGVKTWTQHMSPQQMGAHTIE